MNTKLTKISKACKHLACMLHLLSKFQKVDFNTTRVSFKTIVLTFEALLRDLLVYLVKIPFCSLDYGRSCTEFYDQLPEFKVQLLFSLAGQFERFSSCLHPLL